MDDNGGKHLGMFFREILSRGKQLHLTSEPVVEMSGFQNLSIIFHRHKYTTPVLELVFSCNTAQIFVLLYGSLIFKPPLHRAPHLFLSLAIPNAIQGLYSDKIISIP